MILEGVNDAGGFGQVSTHQNCPLQTTVLPIGHVGLGASRTESPQQRDDLEAGIGMGKGVILVFRVSPSL